MVKQLYQEQFRRWSRDNKHRSLGRCRKSSLRITTREEVDEKENRETGSVRGKRDLDDEGPKKLPRGGFKELQPVRV